MTTEWDQVTMALSRLQHRHGTLKNDHKTVEKMIKLARQGELRDHAGPRHYDVLDLLQMNTRDILNLLAFKSQRTTRSHKLFYLYSCPEYLSCYDVCNDLEFTDTELKLERVEAWCQNACLEGQSILYITGGDGDIPPSSKQLTHDQVRRMFNEEPIPELDIYLEYQNAYHVDEHGLDGDSLMDLHERDIRHAIDHVKPHKGALVHTVHHFTVYELIKRELDVPIHTARHLANMLLKECRTSGASLEAYLSKINSTL